MLSCMNGYPCFLQSFKPILFYDVCSIVPLRDVGNKMLPLLKGNVIIMGLLNHRVMYPITGYGLGVNTIFVVTIVCNTDIREVCSRYTPCSISFTSLSLA